VLIGARFPAAGPLDTSHFQHRTATSEAAEQE